MAAPDDRRDDEVDDGVLGIAHGPAPQTDADRALPREPSLGRTGSEPDTVDTPFEKDQTGYGGPKPGPGLHVED